MDNFNNTYTNFGIYNPTGGSVSNVSALSLNMSTGYYQGLTGFVPNGVSNTLGGSVIQGDLQSNNFLTTVSGWQIQANGNVEFNNGKFRGEVDIGDPTGAEVVIAGNDINLYDFSIGGTGNITGDTASINFIRRDGGAGEFIIQKRHGKDFDADNVFEMFYTAPPIGKHNFIFIGRDGIPDTSSINTGSISFATNLKTTESASSSNGFFSLNSYVDGLDAGLSIFTTDNRNASSGVGVGVSATISGLNGGYGLVSSVGIKGVGSAMLYNYAGIGFGDYAVITNISIISNVVTVTCDNDFSSYIGSNVILRGLTFATFLEEVILSIATANTTQFTATFTHVNYTSHSDTGTALITSLDVGIFMEKTGTVTLGDNFIPYFDNIFDIGSASLGIKDIYLKGSLHGGGIYSGSQFFECIPMTMNDPNIVNGAWGGSNGAGASESVLGAYSQFNCGTGIGAFLYTQQPYYNLFETGKTLTIDWQLVGISSIADGELHLQLITTQNSTSTSVSQVTFLIFKGNITGICADGVSGQTTAQLGTTLLVGEQRTRLRAVLKPGTDCKFYVNDVLQGTLTMNLPATSSPYIQIWASPTAATNRTYKVGRIIITKDY